MMQCLWYNIDHVLNPQQTPYIWNAVPDSKVHGANMGPTWGRQDPGGPHFGPMNFAIWVNSGLSVVSFVDTVYSPDKFIVL